MGRYFDWNTQIIVMNQKTWEAFEKNTMETASLQSDPIGYIGRFTGIDVVIDNDLKDNLTEIWIKDVYFAMKEMDKHEKELGNDN